MDSTETVFSSGRHVQVEELQNTGMRLSVCIGTDFTIVWVEIGYWALVRSDLNKIITFWTLNVEKLTIEEQSLKNEGWMFTTENKLSGAPWIMLQLKKIVISCYS